MGRYLEKEFMRIFARLCRLLDKYKNLSSWNWYLKWFSFVVVWMYVMPRLIPRGRLYYIMWDQLPLIVSIALERRIVQGLCYETSQSSVWKISDQTESYPKYGFIWFTCPLDLACTSCWTCDSNWNIPLLRLCLCNLTVQLPRYSNCGDFGCIGVVSVKVLT